MRISDWSSDVCSSDLIQFAASVGEVGQQQSADADGRHQPDLAVAMLAEHKRIDAARCDIEFSCQQCAQAAGIEQRARTDDSARGETGTIERSEEHTSELQSLMLISYDVFCLKKKTTPEKIP